MVVPCANQSVANEMEVEGYGLWELKRPLFITTCS
jgi:hypothetical protein